AQSLLRAALRTRNVPRWTTCISTQACARLRRIQSRRGSQLVGARCAGGAESTLLRRAVQTKHGLCAASLCVVAADRTIQTGAARSKTHCSGGLRRVRISKSEPLRANVPAVCRRHPLSIPIRADVCSHATLTAHDTSDGRTSNARLLRALSAAPPLSVDTTARAKAAARSITQTSWGLLRR